MKIVFMGTPDFSVPILEALVKEVGAENIVNNIRFYQLLKSFPWLTFVPFV